MQDISVHQVLDWPKQIEYFSGGLLMHSVALEERTGGRPATLRILFGPRVWPQLTERLRISIGVSVGMGVAGVRGYGRVTFEKTVSDPLMTPARYPVPKTRSD